MDKQFPLLFVFVLLPSPGLMPAKMLANTRPRINILFSHSLILGLQLKYLFQSLSPV